MMMFCITGWYRNQPMTVPTTTARALITTRRRSSARCSRRDIRPSGFLGRRRGIDGFVTATGGQFLSGRVGQAVRSGPSDVVTGLEAGLLALLRSHHPALDRLLGHQGV